MTERKAESRSKHEPQDFESIIEMSKAVYPNSVPWRAEQLASHLRVFPEGQFVAIDAMTTRWWEQRQVLIIRWDDYDFTGNWRDYTDAGMFTNHDPENGRTLYGAEVMVNPKRQSGGIGSKLYRARRELVERLGLLRIRAAARLRGYHRHAARMTADEYVTRVVAGVIRDPTLSFQLKQGFVVLGVVMGYLQHDPESLGYAAVIEWLNPAVATPQDYAYVQPQLSKLAR